MIHSSCSIVSSKSTVKVLTCRYLSRQLSGQRDTLESRGSRVRFPAEAYIIILKFSLTELCSHSGEDHTNEIKHDIHPE